MQAIRKNAAAPARAPGVATAISPTTTGTSAIRNRLSQFGRAARGCARRTVSAACEDTSAALSQVPRSIAEDAAEVLPRLGDRGDAARVVDAPCPRVVRGDGQRDVAGVAVEQRAEVTHTALDV